MNEEDRRVLAYFRTAPDGTPKLDWETFTQSKDWALRRFAGDPECEAKTFRVAMRRSPYRGEDSSKRESVSLSVSGVSMPSSEIEVILDPESGVGSYIASVLRIGQMRQATLRLEWAKEESGSRSITIDELLCWNLYGVNNQPL